jgi:hypothetical protein
MQLEATSEPRQVPWCGQLSERTESLRKQILSRGLRWDFFQDDDRDREAHLVLSLHAEPTVNSVPQLEGVLEALLRLQPVRLVVDLVDRVQVDTLKIILRRTNGNDPVALRPMASEHRSK